MRRTILFVATSSLLIATAATRGAGTAAQTGSGAIQESSQLRLPASAFPSDYSEGANHAWTVSHAEGSSFSKMHVQSYTALGMQGAWYQYYDKPLVMTSGGVTYVSSVEVVYLGTYYPDTASAANAYSDVLSNSKLPAPTTCSYGTRCVTYSLDLDWQGVTYSALARIVQLGNAVAEIRSDVWKNFSGLVGIDQFTSNVDGVSQAFVRAVNSLVPTSTPIPPTATPTSTPTPTPTLTPTATPTTIPLSFEVLSVRAEKYGSKPDMSLRRSPLKQVKVGTKVYLSIYVLVRSAPPGSTGTDDFRLTLAGGVVLHRTRQMTISSTGAATYRGTVTFKATKPGIYTFRGTVMINGETKRRSTTIRVVK